LPNAASLAFPLSIATLKVTENVGTLAGSSSSDDPTANSNPVFASASAKSG
jgi:hypothetical protein